MKLLFGIYMKNSYFFHILLNIGRSDMKQTAKNSVRSMLLYPFTLFWILAHTFFFVLPFFFWLDWITHRFVVAHPYTKVHTPRSIHQASFEGSNVHTPAYFYIEKKLQMSTFLVTYIRKNPFELPEVHTRPYTIICSDPPHIMCHVLSFSSLFRAHNPF